MAIGSRARLRGTPILTLLAPNTIQTYQTAKKKKAKTKKKLPIKR